MVNGVLWGTNADQTVGRRRRGQPEDDRPSSTPSSTEPANVVERCSGLKQFGAVATRFDKPAARCLARLRLASLIRRLRES